MTQPRLSRAEIGRILAWPVSPNFAVGIEHAQRLAQYCLELMNALEQIRNDEGKVCEEYEICDHVACHSSYNAYAIADAALLGIPLNATLNEYASSEGLPASERNWAEKIEIAKQAREGGRILREQEVKDAK